MPGRTATAGMKVGFGKDSRGKGIALVYDPTPVNKFIAVNANLKRDWQDLNWMWKSRAGGREIDEIMEDNELNIWSEGQYSWPENTKTYNDYKIEMGFTPLRKMVATGRLFAAATDKGAGDNISVGDSRGYTWGVNTDRLGDYPRQHDFGRRPFMHFQEKTVKAIKRLFRMASQERMRGLRKSSGLNSMRGW